MVNIIIFIKLVGDSHLIAIDSWDHYEAKNFRYGLQNSSNGWWSRRLTR